MKIAITADLHLNSYEETPERYHALEDILNQLAGEKIQTLLICGDLFNANFSNYADFEKLAKKYPDINIWILPGNHDVNVSSRNLVGRNIRVFEQAEIIEDDPQLVFIPYKPRMSMGEIIAEMAGRLKPSHWVLFSHGDWLDGTRITNPMEGDSTYMPLTRTDIERYQPAKTFLGHIHLRLDRPIYYPGSPCGLDISETGPRRFLVFETATQSVVSKDVKTDVIYYDCTLTVLPMDDEVEYVRRQIADHKNYWNIQKDEIRKVRVRVYVQGYTMDKSKLMKTINDEFREFSFYKDESPDLTRVFTTMDQSRAKIAQSVKTKIDDLDLSVSPDEPDHDQILIESLKIIFED